MNWTNAFWFSIGKQIEMSISFSYFFLQVSSLFLISDVKHIRLSLFKLLYVAVLLLSYLLIPDVAECIVWAIFYLKGKMGRYEWGTNRYRNSIPCFY
ncbi:hypothetical protein [Flammeovirga kamogawensis]|nr:hypothetical protein [Flammeovirga kamogawensis]MBB6458877.1 hypothetical protein [Flammeovirga kamogawensis]